MTNYFFVTIGKIGKIISIFILLVLAYLFILPVPLKIIGYYPDGIGWKVAQQIVEQNGKSSDCNKIIHLIGQPFSPTQGEQRALCIYTYAELAKDPTACELLMPSEYGLACVSNLWPEVLPDDGCGWDPNNRMIYQCRHDGGQLVKNKDCNGFKAFEKEYSACVYDYAEREKNLEKCAEVPDAQIRSFCEVRIGSWQKYPQLRNSFYFGKAASSSSFSPKL